MTTSDVPAMTRKPVLHRHRLLLALATGCCWLLPLSVVAADAGNATEQDVAAAVVDAPELAEAPTELASSAAIESRSAAVASPQLTLGVGDAVSVQVYGKPELATTTYSRLTS